MILTGALRELMEGVFNSKSHDSTLIFAIAILQIHLFQLLLPLMCVRFSTNLTISLCQQLLWFCLSAWSAYKKPFFGTSIWIAYLCQRISYASIRTECVVLNPKGVVSRVASISAGRNRTKTFCAMLLVLLNVLGLCSIQSLLSL